MGRGSANPVVLSVVSNGDRVTRKWKVKINMIPCNNLEMAPSGCLQYYRSPTAIIKSFNYGAKVEERSRYLSNLRYTSCIRVEEVISFFLLMNPLFSILIFKSFFF